MKKIADKIEKKLLFHPAVLDKNYDFNIKYHNKMLKTINKNIVLEERYVDNINVIHLKNPKTKNYILFAHGNSHNIEGRIDYLYQLGKYSSIILFDYSGYGKSKGVPSEKQMYKDIFKIWNYLTSVENIEAKNITLYGRSLGSSVVSWLGHILYNNITKPNAVIMHSGFSDIRNMGADIMPKIVVPFISNKFNSKYYVSVIENKIPIYVLHSEDDELINIRHKDILMKNNKHIVFHKIYGTHNEFIFDKEYITFLKNVLV